MEVSIFNKDGTVLTLKVTNSHLHFVSLGGGSGGSYEIGSAVRRFLGIVSLDFSKFWHGARNPYEVVRDIAGFSRKFFLALKIGKMDRKWAKKGFF